MADPNPFAIPQAQTDWWQLPMDSMSFFRAPGSQAEEKRKAGQLFGQEQQRIDTAMATNNMTSRDMANLPGLEWGVLPTSTRPVAGSQSARAPLRDRIIWQESRGKNGVVSPKGALGLMQVMPATGREVARKLGVSFDPQRLRNDPDYNKQIGEAYLNELNQMFDGNETLVAAAYNGGMGRVRTWLAKIGDPRSGAISDEEFARRIPIKETRDYVKNVVFDGKYSGRMGNVSQDRYAPNAAAYAPLDLKALDPSIADKRPMPRKGKQLDLPDAPQQARLGDAPQMAQRNLEQELALMAALQPREKSGFDFLQSALAQAAMAGGRSDGMSLGAQIGAMGGAFGGTYQGARSSAEAEQQQFLMQLLAERLAGEQANRETSDMNAMRVDSRAGQNNTIDFNNAVNQNAVLTQEVLANTGLENSFIDALNNRDSQVFDMRTNLMQGVVGTANQETQLNSGLAQALDEAARSGLMSADNANRSVDQFNIGQDMNDAAQARQDAQIQREMYRGLTPDAADLVMRAGLPAQMQLGTPEDDAKIRLFAQSIAMGQVPTDVLLASAMNEPGFRKGLPIWTGMVFDQTKGATPEELMANRLAVLKRYVTNSGDPNALDNMLAGVQSENPILKIYRAR